jgi:hypothetical protein
MRQRSKWGKQGKGFIAGKYVWLRLATDGSGIVKSQQNNENDQYPYPDKAVSGAAKTKRHNSPPNPVMVYR